MVRWCWVDDTVHYIFIRVLCDAAIAYNPAVERWIYYVNIFQSHPVDWFSVLWLCSKLDLMSLPRYSDWVGLSQQRKQKGQALAVSFVCHCSKYIYMQMILWSKMIQTAW